jgi:hypothetical protein
MDRKLCVEAARDHPDSIMKAYYNTLDVHISHNRKNAFMCQYNSFV